MSRLDFFPDLANAIANRMDELWAMSPIPAGKSAFYPLIVSHVNPNLFFKVLEYTVKEGKIKKITITLHGQHGAEEIDMYIPIKEQWRTL